jgi:predicted  nucleic acid-binding Zn-ribbon protein
MDLQLSKYPRDLEGVMSRVFVSFILTIVIVLVGYGSAEANCCLKPHKSRPAILPNPEHCCDRAESEVAELRKIEQQLTDIKGAIDTNTAAVNDAKAKLVEAIQKGTTDVAAAVKDTTTAVNNTKNSVDDTKARVVEAIQKNSEDVTAAVKDTTTAVNNTKNSVDDAKAKVVEAVQKSSNDITAAVKDTTTAVNNTKNSVDDTKARVVEAIQKSSNDITAAVNDTKTQIETTGKGITAAITVAGERLKREIQAARNVLDALYSRPNSFSVNVSNDAVPCPHATESGKSCP